MIKDLTDDTKESNKNRAFLKTHQNAKYIDSTIKNIYTPKEVLESIDVSSIKIIGITGTNGKTSTAAIIYSLLLDLGYKVAMQGTRGFFVNEEQIEDKSLTTPSILNTIKHLHIAKENDCQYFVMEVSSHAIHQKRIEGIEYELKILTNITSDHLDYHKTYEEYKSVKESFFLGNAKKLINKDTIEIKFDKSNAYTYSLDKPATFKVDAYSLKNGITALIKHISENASFESNLCGVFNVYNLLAAVSAVKIVTKTSLEKICEQVPNFLGVSGRAEVVHSKPSVIVDFAHTEDGIKNILESLKTPNLIVVFGAGGDRDKSKRAKMGKTVQHYAKEIIITNDNPRSEDPIEIIQDIIEGLDEDTNALAVPDRKQAIYKALSLANEDDIVCILGKGDETYIEIDNQKIPHNDKACVLEYYN
ncbi:MAG: UDP-N-acetylmuramoylalanyl-D-glutamate--2,6-diaminopimelate ligase (EC [uncultured Campylobacterales bacterium]|uniref:UDP-N-acetylmuramoylalanyl-D-glutamate--2,6-diami nopimelate ligase (EC) n=1 Tax=uncultured Campylobacterales bacterium TaxID=352960 RepID=A0A6S6SQK1_9BACT|nr:MAG: UDP-N-acetylmuramoylalanyl-D-glutamate--2,6-diaminopimelate ligase (EC [uncultured Campylobacterales bacterium]